jgi:hypothetical protein
MSDTQIEKDVDAVFERTQKLVDQYYALNLDVTKIRADVDGRLTTLTQELKHLSERIPEKLNEDMLRVSITLAQLVADVKQIGEDLKQDYVSRTEFEVLKVEHDQLKKLAWGLIATVLTALITGAVAVVVFNRG